MPDVYSRDHKARVADYVARANGGHRLASGIMGSWRSLEGKRRDGNLVPVYANVADIRNSEERYFLAVFKDRTRDKELEESLRQAVEESQSLRMKAEAFADEAEKARASAEDSLLRQKRLSGQISLLRQIFMGTIMLVVMLGILVVAQWIAGITDPDGLAMVERVLLVLTGILGSAMASVFDSRNRVE
jgi:hypothetical protein